MLISGGAYAQGCCNGIQGLELEINASGNIFAITSYAIYINGVDASNINIAVNYSFSQTLGITLLPLLMKWEILNYT